MKKINLTYCLYLNLNFLLSKIDYLLFCFVIDDDSKLKACNYYLDHIPSQRNKLLFDSNNQISNLNSSIFSSDGDVIITNYHQKKFIA